MTGTPGLRAPTMGSYFIDGLPDGPLLEQPIESDEDALRFLNTPPSLDVVETVQASASLDEVKAQGGMIALIPSSDDRQRMYFDGGEPLEDLHLTLAFLGDDLTDMDASVHEELITRMRAFASTLKPITAHGFGISMFNPRDDACWVLICSGDDLGPVHDSTWKILNGMSGLDAPKQYEPWIPHVTLVYDDDTDWMLTLHSITGPVVFDVLRVVVAGETHDFSLYSGLESGGGEVSYSVLLRSDAPASKPWAVVREYDGAIVACHPTADLATKQLSIVYNAARSGLNVAFVGGEPYADGKPLAAEAVAPVADETAEPMETDAQPTGSWEGILVVEGVETGDGREFAPGSLTWADLPIPIMWQRQTIGEGHLGSVIVARAEKVWRNGNEIWGSGVFDINGADGKEAYRQVREGFLKGISIDPDQIKDADIEYVFPNESGDGESLEALFAMPDKTIFHAGRIRGATLVSLPAFVEAQINLTDGTQVDMAAMPVSGTGEETVVASSSIIASMHTITFDDVPPAEWFNEPTDVEVTGALTITDEARVYGYLAPAGVSHRSFNRKVTVPMGNVDYTRFMKGETIVAGGGRVTCGTITMGCGHASVAPGVTGEVAAEHYDNTCSLFANIAVGENTRGVWVAGALMPGVTKEQITAAMACQLSGDWRPLTQPIQGKSYELRAALLVPVPGFPMARVKPSVRFANDVLVASAVPVHVVASPNPGTMTNAAAKLRERLGIDAKTQALALRDRLRKG